MTETTSPGPEAAVDDPFIAPVPMEEDPAELFAGDSGTLDAEVRRVLVRLLQRRFLLAERNAAQWKVLLDNQQVIESRLHDLYVHLVVDHERGVAYKRQVRSAESDVPVLLRDEAYTRAETLVLVHLRSVFQRSRGEGESSVRVDVEEIEQTALTYFDPDDTNVAARQREIRTAVARLAKEGVVEEESEGRFRVTPLVEIVLSNERLAELSGWLREQVRTGGTVVVDDELPAPDDADGPDEPAAAEAPDPAGSVDPGEPVEPVDTTGDVDAGPTLEEAAADDDTAASTDTAEEVAR